MGLDMYLSAKRYLFSFNEHDKALADKIDAEIGGNSFGRTKEISREAMYWRKSNAIHHWFVINVQHGEDNCKEYYVSRDKLQELLDTLKQVDQNHSLAEDLLPIEEGFFFGATDYNEWYYKDIQDTILVFDKLLSENLDQWDFYYSSSW
jgi:hypothetical protein